MAWEEALEEHVKRNEAEFNGVARAFGEMRAFIGEQIASVTNRIDRLEFNMNARFEAADGRFEAIDQRFDAIDRRFEAVDQRFDAIDRRFEAVDQRFGAIDLRFDRVESQLTEFGRRFDRLDGQIELIVKAIVRS